MCSEQNLLRKISKFLKGRINPALCFKVKMNEQWIEIRKSGDYVKMGEELGISPVCARIMRNRGLTDVSLMRSFIEESSDNGHDAFLLYSMNVLVKVMLEKIRERKKIRIIGDYDVDGICATFILYKGLSYLGADCDYTIPHRIEDGYGINIKLIDEAKEAGVDTIITCDNGIAAKVQTDHANELGLSMVITDHHEVPFEEVDGVRRSVLPNADAIVDPKLDADNYPFKGICGAYVAYKVIEALSKEAGMDGCEAYDDLLRELKEFAALATVCDVMELQDENRALVKSGLKLLADSKNTGMRALIEATGLKGRVLSVYHLGFVIGPCLNASGRLDTSLKALSLFCDANPVTAMQKALELKELNESRKQMTLDETAKAIEIVSESETIDKVIVLYLPDCHESLAGIIAGRVKERFFHPTLVFTDAENGIKGSGRSIEAYDMFEELSKVKDLFTKFGGHKMAAGVSLPKDNFEELKIRLNENCELKDDDFKDTVRIDMELPFAYANLALARDIARLEPFGTGNPEPLFARRDVTFLSGRIIGKNGNAARYKVSDGDGRVYEMVYFGDLCEIEDYVESMYGAKKRELLHMGRSVNIKLDVCYKLSVNTYNNTESANMTLKYFR